MPIVAQLYDALSIVVYPTLAPKMAMKIGGKYKFSELHARHWDRFAEETCLSKAQTTRSIVELAKSVPTTARKLESEPGRRFTGNALVGQIIELLEQHCAPTIRRLTDPSAGEE